MPKVKANWNEIAAGERIEEGSYPVRIDKVEERQSRTDPKGPGYWNVEMTFMEEPYTGRKVWDVFSLKPNALWKLRSLCDTIGVDLEGRDDLDSEELLSHEVGVNVIEDEYEGKLRPKVDGYFALSG